MKKTFVKAVWKMSTIFLGYSKLICVTKVDYQEMVYCNFMFCKFF